MDDRSRAARAKLRAMPPSISIPYIRSFQLPAEEELVLIEIDARGKSRVQVAMEQHLCVETIRNRRRAALMKIADL